MIDSSSPNQPIQNYEIVNSGLEAQVAALLPSVAGYGGNLRSTNTIIPVVDLTAAAEGSNVPESLQMALAFGSQTGFIATNTTTVVANTPGFWRIFGTSAMKTSGSVQTNSFTMTDGLSVKTIWGMRMGSGSVENYVDTQFDFIVFLDAGESISAVSSNANNHIVGSSRQVATKDGTLVTPSGF